MKAILIETKNQDVLASRYGIEKWEYEDRLPLGYWFVTEFGNEETFEVLTDELFTATFNVIGDIENGFKEIERK